MTARRAGRRRCSAVVVLALVGAMATSTASYAEPDVTDDDVRAAQAAVRGTASEVAAIELELAAQSATLDTAWGAVAAAAEDYAQATVTRDAAALEAADAAEREASAAEAVEAARSELGAIAMQAYRSGGSMDGLGAMLSADGFEDLVDRTDAMDRLGSQAERLVQQFEAADLVASTMGRRADEAAQTAATTAEAAEGALADAEALQAQAEAKVAQIAREREQLISRLAEYRQTSIEVERARQATLEAERTARAEAAAAAEAGVTTTGPSPTVPPDVPPATTPVTPPTTPVTADPPATTPPAADPPPAPTTPTAVQATPAPPASPDRYGLGTGSQRGSAAQGDAAVAWAVQQVGKAYALGATGPDSFDCSGLTSQAWKAAGVGINRTSRDQYRQVLKITYAEMRPGDLIFYGSVGTDPGSITHVAMFVGNGQMVEAPRPDVAVRVTSIRWSGTMPFAGRP
ncbi:NlpC/P60 family protein [Cellulomonas sp. KRMCY2]|uniref:C40 family peptidase n=1 Tax=Cellulomonas sp. KRMCY2 TaxID=1304865 RepID=UPI0004AE3302|nr:NlpC/P60 family protein [Cellulomonas sp. KRMCY2]